MRVRLLIALATMATVPALPIAGQPLKLIRLASGHFAASLSLTPGR